MRFLLLGSSSGRLDCLAEALTASGKHELAILTNYANPGLMAKGRIAITGGVADPAIVADWATYHRTPDSIAVISNEEPLAAGVADRLLRMDIPVVGPTQALAQIESSKIFSRSLLDRCRIPGNPQWRAFAPGHDSDLIEYLHLIGRFVVKPSGLTGGKGVRVQGDHFDTLDEGLAYCRSVLGSGESIIIEQKLDGEEFSLHTLSDGRTVVHLPVVQDCKRLRNGDKGPQTGGMGSWASATLQAPPWLQPELLVQAHHTNHSVLATLQTELREHYRGILYGSYIVTKDGLRVIEFNARFGDPEVMNLLPLLETDFADIAIGIATGTLCASTVRFKRLCSVVKYLVPEGHPDNPIRTTLDLSGLPVIDGLHTYWGSVDHGHTTGSRAIAFVGVAERMQRAERIAEQAALSVPGQFFHRTDIGSARLLRARRKRLDDILAETDPGHHTPGHVTIRDGIDRSD
jgi:phosphoribosylamine---glycine ligase